MNLKVILRYNAYRGIHWRLGDGKWTFYGEKELGDFISKVEERDVTQISLLSSMSIIKWLSLLLGIAQI